MDNKLLSQLKEDGTEVSVCVMNDFAVKGKVVDFDDGFIKLESEQRNFKKKFQLVNRIYITKIVTKD